MNTTAIIGHYKYFNAFSAGIDFKIDLNVYPQFLYYPV